MGSTTASVGEAGYAQAALATSKSTIYSSILSLSGWLERNDYRGYDTFDGLSSPWARLLTFEITALRTVLLQGVRRFPVNLRPLLGIARQRSSKGMGFLARGFMRLHRATGDPEWGNKARAALEWLVAHQTPGYSGACWGNHFDYQSREFYLPKGVPTIVWTSLIGHAFLDAYEYFEEEDYLRIAHSACEHILGDLEICPEGSAVCISYIPGKRSLVHNANTLGASLLARTYFFTGVERYKDVAKDAIRYTAQHQLGEGSWYYGERNALHWIDNFHTAYVLDCFKYYTESTDDRTFMPQMMSGYEYWKKTFFLDDGTPRYYNNKTLPLDIQCSSQAIDTLVFFKDYDADSLGLAVKVAEWSIANMQDASGYFYYRRYGHGIVNKTPTLHWGQATMMCALAGLYGALESQGAA